MSDGYSKEADYNPLHVETFGVAPVPHAKRIMGPGMLFLIWALASASVSTPIIGLVLKGVGLWNFVWVVVFAFLIDLIPSMLLSHMGRQVPVISMVMAKRTFGIGGASAIAILFTVVDVVWIGVSTDVGGKILDTLFPGKGVLWCILLGVMPIVIVFFGMEMMEKFYKYTSLLFLLCYAILIYYLFMHYSFVMPVATTPMNWGKSIDLMLSFSLVAVAFPTATRFCLPADCAERPTRRFLYMLAPVTGVMLAKFLMGLLGLVAVQMTGDWNIALLDKNLPVWGVISVIATILSLAHHNTMNLYQAVTKFLMTVNVKGRSQLWMQPSAVVLLGAISTSLAFVEILNFIGSFLHVLGSLVFPFTFILVFNWFYERNYADPVSLFYKMPRSWPEYFLWPAPWAICMLMVGIGLAQSRYCSGLQIMDIIPWQALSAMISGFVYYLGLRLTKQRL